ncbi:hypothetical protein A3A66_03480 [Microgenomates group bacterium RIFCSPLOWO2_01_FULL_46_13]|nr:MAG: hypothetical protein A3A66_03480 [Microgenomates group bacterium RIFCSPLOWO2_01_FULL_46_13]
MSRNNEAVSDELTALFQLLFGSEADRLTIDPGKINKYANLMPGASFDELNQWLYQNAASSMERSAIVAAALVSQLQHLTTLLQADDQRITEIQDLVGTDRALTEEALQILNFLQPNHR